MFLIFTKISFSVLVELFFVFSRALKKCTKKHFNKSKTESEREMTQSVEKLAC